MLRIKEIKLSTNRENGKLRRKYPRAYLNLNGYGGTADKPRWWKVMVLNEARRFLTPIGSGVTIVNEALKDEDVEDFITDFICGQENAQWSMRAGCSCGCSPGFILKDMIEADWDLHIDVVDD